MPSKYEYIRPSAALLERFALRAGEILGRHGDSSPWFVPFEATLPPLVVAYVALLADVRRREKQTQQLNRMSRDAVQLVVEDMNGYFVAVSRDVPEFERGDYPATTVPEDVVQQSRRFSGFVRSHTNEVGEGLPYAEQVVDSQTALADRAEALAHGAKDAMAELTAQRRELHASALALHADLVAFRQVVRKVLGRGHRDYQALRYRRGASVGAEAGEAEAVTDDGDADLAQLEADLRAESVAPVADAPEADSDVDHVA